MIFNPILRHIVNGKAAPLGTYDVCRIGSNISIFKKRKRRMMKGV